MADAQPRVHVEGGWTSRATQPARRHLGSPSGSLHFDQRFADGEVACDLRPVGEEDFLEARVRCVADRQPQNPWRRTELLDQVYEVRVLGEHDGVGVAGTGEDLVIGRIAKTEVAQRPGTHSERLDQPRRECR